MSDLSNKIRENFVKPVVLVENVSRILTEAILEGTLKEGDQLIEAELKGQFGISRSPLREAFRVLEKKGLVEIVPRKGTFVREISRRDIEEHFPVRSVLEGLAAKEAYQRITDEDLAAMTLEFENMKQAVDSNDAKAYWEHHSSFHRVWIKACANLLLIDLLTTLRMHTMWYRFSYKYYMQDFRKSLRIHKRILDLFKGKKSDPRKIEAAVRDHIEIAVETFLAFFEERERGHAKDRRLRKG
jgi:DNA-binding GntR family transcriptional regulator